MDPLLKTAFDAQAYRLFVATTITLPNADVIRLLDGSATFDIDGETFTGRDAVYGTLRDIEEITDGTDEDAPQVKVTINPPTDDATDILLDAGMQGSPVFIQVGALHLTTGAVIGLEPLFVGEVDVPTLQVAPQSRSVEEQCVSVFERFFDRDEGQRLSYSYWDSVWSGDLALDSMTGLINQIFWGQATIGPSSTNYTGGGGGQGTGGKGGVGGGYGGGFIQ